MAPSRWERGINEPPAEIYIQLGKMVGEPACWYFWEKAGLRKSDILSVMNNRKGTVKAAAKPERASGPPAVQIIPSARLKRMKAHIPMCAIPLYSTSQIAGAGTRIVAEADEVVIASKEWCDHPDETFSLRHSGDKMAPVLRDGYVVAVDRLQSDASRLDGKMVLASHPEKGLVVHWYQRLGTAEMLVPENRDYPPIYLTEGGWTILGKVVWWLAKAP
jgi:SOS-response transcriptional repressor LexA